MTVRTHNGNQQTSVQWILDAAADYWAVLKLRNRIQQERRLLANLDDRLLNDIGITRAEANFEAARPSSDVPECRQLNSNSCREPANGRDGTVCGAC